MFPDVFDCRGAPRDRGRDQGRACSESLRRGLGGWANLRARLTARDARVARLARDLRRHFPQQEELLDGIARGARVPRAALLTALSARGSAADGAAWRLDGGIAELMRSVPGDAVVRRTSPEGGLRSVELTRPRLTHALLGVNERGLAVAGVEGPYEPGDCAAPASLLAQDCLERFGRVESALEWCLVRPASGHSEILLADARGEAAVVRYRNGGRIVQRSVDGVLCAGALCGREAELAKAGDPFDRDARALFGAPEGEGALARLDPRERVLEVGRLRFVL